MTSYDFQAYWDEAAASFDDEPDHGLRSPVVRAAWLELFERWLPNKPIDILDVGCGTGSLSLLMAGLGHHLTGIDFSSAMLEQAKLKSKAFGLNITFYKMDAAEPRFSPASFDVLICRHVLWALPETAEVLKRWERLVRENGRFLLIEGFWETGDGLHAGEVVAALPDSMRFLTVENLSNRANFWGREVNDERFLVVAKKT